jgi:hypothetical protein
MDLARLTELLSYDPQTGAFTWKVTVGKGVAGTVAGSVRQNRSCSHYRSIDIGIGGKNYRAHRLAWLFVHGSLPDVEVDHIDGDGTNNRIENLRLATHKQNGENTKRRRDNVSGRRGVSLHKATGLWRARVSHHGKETCEYFKTFNDAAEAVDAMRRSAYTHYHGRDLA